MTKEELIFYGKDYLHDLETACCKIEEKHKEFVRESIKSLEKEPFMNKDCVSAGVCEHDKMQVLENLRAEIMELQTYKLFNGEDTTVYVERNDLLEIIDKHRNGE